MMNSSSGEVMSFRSCRALDSRVEAFEANEAARMEDKESPNPPLFVLLGGDSREHQKDRFIITVVPLVAPL